MMLIEKYWNTTSTDDDTATTKACNEFLKLAGCLFFLVDIIEVKVKKEREKFNGCQ